MQRKSSKKNSVKTTLKSKKSDFISTAMHHVRTPLTIERLHIEMLYAENFGRLNREQKKALGEILDYNKKVSEMFASVHLAYKIKSGTLKINPFACPVQNIIVESVLEFEKEAKKKGVKIEIAGRKDLIANADTEYLKIILRHLISNATKHAPKGSSVKIESEAKGGKVLIKISDSGSGISREEKSKIFTELFRGEKEIEKGVGLGLYISKFLTEKFGGKIWFESGNKGTVFSIELLTD